MSMTDNLTDDWLALVKGDIEEALEDADFFLNRLNYFLFENYEEMREDAMSFIATITNCLEESEELVKNALLQKEAELERRKKE